MADMKIGGCKCGEAGRTEPCPVHGLCGQVTCPVCQSSDTRSGIERVICESCNCLWRESDRRPDPRLAALEAERDEQRQRADILDSACVKALDERDRLREALANMLRSQDCAWEERSMGHDWPTACAQARAALEGNGNGN